MRLMAPGKMKLFFKCIFGASSLCLCVFLGTLIWGAMECNCEDETRSPSVSSNLDLLTRLKLKNHVRYNTICVIDDKIHQYQKPDHHIIYNVSTGELFRDEVVPSLNDVSEMFCSSGRVVFWKQDKQTNRFILFSLEDENEQIIFEQKLNFEIKFFRFIDNENMYFISSDHKLIYWNSDGGLQVLENEDVCVSFVNQSSSSSIISVMCKNKKMQKNVKEYIGAEELPRSQKQRQTVFAQINDQCKLQEMLYETCGKCMDSKIVQICEPDGIQEVLVPRVGGHAKVEDGKLLILWYDKSMNLFLDVYNMKNINR
jgi:hypothetical protein